MLWFLQAQSNLELKKSGIVKKTIGRRICTGVSSKTRNFYKVLSGRQRSKLIGNSDNSTIVRPELTARALE